MEVVPLDVAADDDLSVCGSAAVQGDSKKHDETEDHQGRRSRLAHRHGELPEQDLAVQAGTCQQYPAAEPATNRQLQLTRADDSNLKTAKNMLHAGHTASFAVNVLEIIYRHYNPDKLYYAYPIVQRSARNELELLMRVAAKYRVNLAHTFPDMGFDEESVPQFLPGPTDWQSQ